MTDRASARKRKRDALTPPYCEIPGCEWIYNYQRHRIVPGRENGKYKQGNVIALCPNHHAWADDGILPHDYLLEIVRKRIALTEQVEENDGPTNGNRQPDQSWRGTSEESRQGDGTSPTDADNGIDVGSAL